MNPTPTPSPSVLLAVVAVVLAASAARAGDLVLHRGAGSGQEGVVHLSVHGAEPGEMVRLSIFTSVDGVSEAEVNPAANPFQLADVTGAAQFALNLDGWNDLEKDSILMARAWAWREDKPHVSNEVLLRQQKGLFLLVRSAQGMSSTRIVAFDPRTGSVRSIGATASGNVHFDVGGADRSLYFEGSGGAFLHRYHPRGGFTSFERPLAARERILDIVSTADSSGLLVLTSEPTSMDQSLLRLWLLDTSTAEWRRHFDLARAPSSLMEAAVVVHDDNERLFVVYKNQGAGKIREYLLGEDLVQGAWIHPSSEPYGEQLLEVRASGPYLVALTRSRDGQGGRLSVFDVESRQPQFEEVLPARPLRLEVVASESGPQALVLLASGQLLGFSLDLSARVFERTFPGALEIAAHAGLAQLYVLTSSGPEGGRLAVLGLDGQSLQSLPVVLSSRSHDLGVMVDQGRAWLYVLDPDAYSPLIDVLLCWELDPLTGLPFTLLPMPLDPPTLDGTVLRTIVR